MAAANDKTLWSWHQILAFGCYAWCAAAIRKTLGSRLDTNATSNRLVTLLIQTLGLRRMAEPTSSASNRAHKAAASGSGSGLRAPQQYTNNHVPTRSALEHHNSRPIRELPTRATGQNLGCCHADQTVGSVWKSCCSSPRVREARERFRHPDCEIWTTSAKANGSSHQPIRRAVCAARIKRLVSSDVVWPKRRQPSEKPMNSSQVIYFVGWCVASKCRACSSVVDVC